MKYRLALSLIALLSSVSGLCAETSEKSESRSQLERSGVDQGETEGAAAEERSDKESTTKDKTSAAEPVLRDNRVNGPYCGTNSLYICLSAIGVDTKLEDYVSTKYVGSFQGSSAAELIRAAENFGAKAECFSHLTHNELKRAKSPMILHMRSNWADGGYNHWVAFLGYDGDRMRIIDAPHPLQTISAAELLANWDGTGIVIANEEGVDQSFISAARVDYFIAVGLLLLTIYVLKRLFVAEEETPEREPLLARVRHLVIQVGVIVGFAFLLAIGYHTLSEVGFLKNPSALAEVKRRYYSVDIPELTMAKTEAEMATEDPLLLDARRVIDYQHGALPGAVSMSLYSSLPERQKVLAGISKAKRIIVYCQSGGCRYADEVAKFLKFNGYENLAIYREGYREWKKEHAPPAKDDKLVRPPATGNDVAQPVARDGANETSKNVSQSDSNG